jgi:SAM-dependent methyltransferase
VQPSPSFSELLTQCPVCAGTAFETVGATDRHGKPLQTALCDSCGMVFTNPRPNREELEAFYREAYRMAYKGAWRPSPRHLLRAGLVAMERLRMLQPFLSPGMRVHDLGSGGGELLYLLRQAGHEVSGTEPNEGYGCFARDELGLPVQIGGYEQAAVASGSQDLVTMFHVLEHLARPVEALRHVLSWVRPGGRLLVEVPNVLSASQWPRSRFHLAHLLNFSPSTLAMAGRRAGWIVLDQFNSDDGGNTACLFERPVSPASVVEGCIPGHAARVRQFLRCHTTLRHALSLAPYTRPLRKMRRRLEERRLLKTLGTEPRAMLDQLAAEARRETDQVAAATAGLLCQAG